VDDAEDGKETAKADDRKKEKRAAKDKGDETIATGKGSDAMKVGDKPDDKKKEKEDKGGGGAKLPKDNLDGAILGEGDKDELGIGDVMSGGGGKKEKKAERTELASKDMRAGLSKIEGKAKSCYDKYGIAGTAKVKLTIDPKGTVSKATATGEFAGTPTGDCVVAAVKSATFPDWDGAPQSTTFVVLLSD
jgi:hypothetical protein